MTGPTRRAFEAEMTLKYCGGSPLMAEAVLGWGRQTVALGLAERRTGILGLGAQGCIGKKGAPYAAFFRGLTNVWGIARSWAAADR